MSPVERRVLVEADGFGFGCGPHAVSGDHVPGVGEKLVGVVQSSQRSARESIEGFSAGGARAFEALSSALAAGASQFLVAAMGTRLDGSGHLVLDDCPLNFSLAFGDGLLYSVEISRRKPADGGG